MFRLYQMSAMMPAARGASIARARSQRMTSNVAACNPMATANTLNRMPRAAMTAQITIVAPESVRRLPGGFESAPADGGAFGPAAGGIVMPLLPGPASVEG